MKEIVTLEGTTVYQDDDRWGRVHFIGDMDVDYDGANGQTGRAGYYPDNSGVENLKNAGYPDHPSWYRDIFVCDSNDQPVRQGPEDPAPGAFISMTAYEWSEYKRTDPRRYLDANSVPYMVVSPTVRGLAKGVVLGCLCRMTNLDEDDLSTWGIVGDISAPRSIGEASSAAARALRIDPNPRSGGVDRKIVLYEFWPNYQVMIFGKLAPLIRM